MSYAIHGDFLKDAQQFFEQLPEVATHAAMMAINQVAERKVVPAIRRAAESEVAFPRGYLDSPDRLEVSRKATRGSLEAVVTGRDRPTSLARFAPGHTPENTRKGGVTVQVKRGRTQHLKKAFLVRLNNGNIGLAVRLKQGETLRNKREKAVKLGLGVYLLYGPSVDQVMKSVVEDSIPEIGDMLSNEFYRQFARLTHG